MRFLYLLSILPFLILATPIMLILYIVMYVSTGSPVIFKQLRIGKKGKPFTMYKFRTMVVNAESEKRKLLKLNESDGPTFKINNDPRFTQFGRILSRTGLDELPQFINIIKGDMNLIGPRPFPVDEARLVPQKYKIRETVLPGIISPWVVSGMHEMKFDEWMKLDKKYIQEANATSNLIITLKSCKLIIRNICLVLIDLLNGDKFKLDAKIQTKK